MDKFSEGCRGNKGTAASDGDRRKLSGGQRQAPESTERATPAPVCHTSERVALPPVCCGYIDRSAIRRMWSRQTCAFFYNGMILWRCVFSPRRVASPQRIINAARASISAYALFSSACAEWVSPRSRQKSDSADVRADGLAAKVSIMSILRRFPGGCRQSLYAQLTTTGPVPLHDKTDATASLAPSRTRILLAPCLIIQVSESLAEFETDLKHYWPSWSHTEPTYRQ